MRTYIPLLAIITIALSALNIHAQNLSDQNPCATHHIHTEMMQSDPVYKQKYESVEAIIYKQMLEKQQNGKNAESATVYTIPVVVHVIHETGTPIGTAENLSYNQVAQIIQGLNDDYSHASGITYSNPLYGVDTDIEFCLAARDPNGNPTDGIDRHADNARTIFDRNNSSNNPVPSLQQMYHWTPTEYYNIYIIKNIIGAAGFAYYPSAHGNPIDGAVMEYNVSSGVWSHECGHALNLPHTFGNGCSNDNCLVNGDRVCDTPPKQTSGYGGGSCASPANSCSTDEDDTSTNNPYRPVSIGGMGDQVDMFENYMDYTGSCWSAFTQGQKDRMRAAVLAYRSSYLTSQACVPPVALDAAVVEGFVRDTCAAPVVGIDAAIGNFGNNTLTSVDVELRVDGILLATVNWTGSLDYGEVDTVSFPFVPAATGTHNICIKTVNPNGGNDGNTSNDELCGSVFVDMYCRSYSTNTSFFWLDSLSIETIENQSGNNNGYANFTSMSTDIARDYPVHFYLKPYYTSNTYNLYWKIWIDYNQDYDFDDAGELAASVSGTGPLSGSFTVPTTANLGNTRMRIVMSFYSNTGSAGAYPYGETEDYTVKIIDNGCYTINTFPYEESFEAGIGDWTQVVTDDMDWSVRAGSTPSNNTGPNAAMDGNYYIYTEASSPNYPSKSAQLTSPCFDLSVLSNPEIHFDWHMYGLYMGTLELHASTDGGITWPDILWQKSGNQGNAWYTANIDLSAYTNQQSVKFRFAGTTGSSFSSDMAIDKIQIIGATTDCKIVQNTLPDGPGSLRAAIACANAGDTITFSPDISNQTVELAVPAIIVNKPLFIIADPGSNITISNENINNTQILINIQNTLHLQGVQLIGQSPDTHIFRIEAGGSLEMMDGKAEMLEIGN